MCFLGFDKWVSDELVGTATTGSTTSGERVQPHFMMNGNQLLQETKSLRARFPSLRQSIGKKSPRLHFTLAYELRDDPQGTRLVTRMRSRIRLPLGSLIGKLILGPGDGIMLRRQLLTIEKNASKSSSEPR